MSGHFCPWLSLALSTLRSIWASSLSVYHNTSLNTRARGISPWSTLHSMAVEPSPDSSLLYFPWRSRVFELSDGLVDCLTPPGNSNLKAIRKINKRTQLQRSRARVGRTVPRACLFISQSFPINIYLIVEKSNDLSSHQTNLCAQRRRLPQPLPCFLLYTVHFNFSACPAVTSAMPSLGYAHWKDPQTITESIIPPRSLCIKKMTFLKTYRGLPGKLDRISQKSTSLRSLMDSQLGFYF